MSWKIQRSNAIKKQKRNSNIFKDQYLALLLIQYSNFKYTENRFYPSTRSIRFDYQQKEIANLGITKYIQRIKNGKSCERNKIHD